MPDLLAKHRNFAMFGGGKLSIPKLETQRLILRGFEARDFDGYAAMMADPDVASVVSNVGGWGASTGNAGTLFSS